MAEFFWTMICRRKFQSLAKCRLFLAKHNFRFRYPKFMERPSGRRLQQRIWQETRDVLEGAVPEVKPVYALLDGKGDVVGSQT